MYLFPRWITSCYRTNIWYATKVIYDFICKEGNVVKVKRFGALGLIAVILSIIFYVILVKPTIEQHNWVLLSAQQADAPHHVMAHKEGLDISEDDGNIFAFSKGIELICTAKDGKLTLTDKTNNKTYEGTYKVSYGNRFASQAYDVVIGENKGSANMSSGVNGTLFVSIGSYYLNFEKE